MKPDEDENDDFDVSSGGAMASAFAAVASPTAAVLPGSSNLYLPFALGRYTLTKRLGIGGMAEVFLAEQTGAAGFKNLCVVKRMLPHLALQPKYVEMFLHEANLASKLKHANIVQIWDLGEVDGQYFIAMEHIAGLPLNVLARTAWELGCSIPMEVVCCALADAADGLAAAHEHVDEHGKPAPVIHRDISPDNLMINRDGVTKILDFGIARAHNSQRTQAGELKGKVPFMPLEQLRGQAIDGRVDVYALGVTAYWLLTGVRPFTAPTDMALIESILTQEIRPPKEINPHIPDELNALVLQMLEKDREKRLGSMAEVARALEHVVRSRKAIVAPFVQSIMDRPANRAVDAPTATSGFVPSVPETDTISSGWSRAALRPLAATPPAQASPTATTRAGEAEGADVAGASRRLPVLAAVAALAAIAVAVFVVTRSPDVAPVVPVVAVVEVPAREVAPPVERPAVVVPTDVPLELALELDPAASVKPAARRDLAVKAPGEVDWVVDGKVVGSGSTTLKLPATVRSITAVDKKRGGRTTVVVGAKPVDYAGLPKGKLQPRAKPFADVFIGSVALGATPFPAVDVVAGKYTVRYVYKGRTITKSVTVGAGEIGRPTADFTQE